MCRLYHVSSMVSIGHIRTYRDLLFPLIFFGDVDRIAWIAPRGGQKSVAVSYGI